MRMRSWRQFVVLMGAGVVAAAVLWSLAFKALAAASIGDWVMLGVAGVAIVIVIRNRGW